MRRPRALISGALALVVIVVIVLVGIAAAGGGDEETTTRPAPSKAPSGDATPATPAGLPPQFLECLADQGIEVDPSGADLHSLPPQALQACFGSLHGGGGAP
jgi:hypothetical protein